MIRPLELLGNINDILRRKGNGYTSSLVKLARLEGNITIVTLTQQYADELKKKEKINAVSITTSQAGKSRDNVYIFDNQVLECVTIKFKEEIEDNLRLITNLKDKMTQERILNNKAITELSGIINRQAESIEVLQDENKELKETINNNLLLLSSIHKISVFTILKMKFLKLMKLNTSLSMYTEKVISKL